MKRTALTIIIAIAAILLGFSTTSFALIRGFDLCNGLTSNAPDFDGDGAPDKCDFDDDNDGLPDSWELSFGLNPYNPRDAADDYENDGLNNYEEFKLGTDPNLRDTDADGFVDGRDEFPLDPNAAGKQPEDLMPIYVYLDFDGDASFPSITSTAYTQGLNRFEGTAFNLPWDRYAWNRNTLVHLTQGKVAADFAAFSNVIFVDGRTTDAPYWYTVGIDDNAFVFDTGTAPDYEPNISVLPIDPYAMCPPDTAGTCARLWGKGGNYANVAELDEWGYSIFNPMYARVFAGSLSLPNGSANPSSPPLLWGNILPGTGRRVDRERLANAMANVISHELAHLFGAKHSVSGLMDSDLGGDAERGLAFFDMDFDNNSLYQLQNTLNIAATADQFEPNDESLFAAELGPGNYTGLTLDNPLDEDFYKWTVPEGSNGVTIRCTVDRSNYGGSSIPNVTGWTNVSIEYRDCPACPSHVVPVLNRIGGPKFPVLEPALIVTDNGYSYVNTSAPTGRLYFVHIYQRHPRQPMRYDLSVW